MENKGFRKAIFVVIYKIDEKTLKPIYLTLKRKLHWKGWEFTKGGVEKNEKEIDAVKREVLEETGLKAIKIKNHGLRGSYKYKKNIPSRPYIGQEFALYSVLVPDYKVKVDNREHSTYKWFPFNKAVRKLTWSNQKKCLRVVNKSIVINRKDNKFNNLVNN